MIPDLLIVGAGPAGVSAALWARSLGLSAMVLEESGKAGGQLRSVHFTPANLAGAPPQQGPELARRLEEQLREAGVPTRWDAATALEERRPEVTTRSGERIEAEAVLIATGVRRRRLDVPGEREFEARGVSHSARQDRERLAGEEVLVVGGGDGAFESALLLAEVGCRVTVAVRGHPRARAEFRERVAGEPRIEVLDGTMVEAIEGDREVRSARLAGTRGSFTLPVSAVVIKIGVRPNSEWCGPGVKRDPEGYVLVDEKLATSHPFAWAAGDVTRPALFGLAVAEGQGALAVASIRAALRS